MNSIQKKNIEKVSKGMPKITDPKKEPGWPWEPPIIDQAEIIETKEAEIVVVGAGHAGVQCALSAAEGGADVAVIETQPNPKKMRWLGEQIGAFNSNFATKKGFGPYDLMEVIHEFCNCGSYRVNQRLIAMYVKNSGEMLDHNLSLISPDDDLINSDQCNIQEAYGKPAYPVIVGGHKTWASDLQFRGKLITERGLNLSVNERSRLSELEQYAVNKSMELGAKWYGGERAVKLIIENGKVSGVITKSKEGYRRFMGSKAVCVTTGNMTDIGHKMCVWAGGYMDYNIKIHGMPREAARSFGLTGFLLLNCRGKRYCDESNPYNSNAQLLRQPEGVYCAVFDTQWMKYLQNSGLQHGMADFGMPEYLEQVAEDMEHVVEHGGESYGVRSISVSEREEHPIWGANTLPELADILGYEGEYKENFLSEIARYNEMCYQGKDDDFGKDNKLLIPIDKPPFFAGMAYNSKNLAGDMMAPSGIVADENMNVIDKDDNPIPGLYVAGNTLGDRYGLYYPTPTAGNMIGMAMTHGRCLGKLLTGQRILR